MSWSTRFRIRQYLKGSLWFTPLLAVVAGSGLAALDAAVETSIDLPAYWQYSPSAASTILATIVGAMVGLTGFVVTVSVLVVQTATSTFSPRYMRLWYRDRQLKALLAVLVGALAFSFSLLRRITADFVPNLGVTTAGALVVAALLLFLFFLDRCIHRLRPVAVAAVVADLGRRAFQDAVAARRVGSTETEALGEVPAFLVRSPGSGAIQAIDEDGLIRWARERGCVVVLKRSAGDFTVSGAPLIEVFGSIVETERDVRDLAGRFVLGVERTIEQDAAFAIRTLVDIAAKALSSAINDPTTAVQAIDHLGELLRLIGTTDLTTHSHLGDEEGRLRVVLPARRWEDYLALGVTEIREYGAGSVQVMRRLRAMLEDLHDEVLPEHRPTVEDELSRLDATIAQSFGDSIDLDRAVVADRQGIGGPSVALPRALR